MAKSSAVKWLIEKSKKQKWKMAVLIIFNAILSSLSVVFAFAMRRVIDGACGEDSSISKIISGAVFIVIVVLLQLVLRILVNGLSEHIKGKLEIAYKSHIFSEILNKKYEDITSYHSGELVNRLSSDVTIVADGVTNILPTVISSGVRLISAVISIVYLDWVFAIVFIGCGLLVVSIIALLRGKLKSLHKSTQTTDGKVRSFMQECIENILAVKVFSANDKIKERSDKLQNENFIVKMKRRNISVCGSAVYGFIFSAGYIFALIYGSFKIFGDTAGVFTYGTLTAILQLVNNVQVPFVSLSSVFSRYYTMVASAERLIEIENLKTEKEDNAKDALEIYDKMKSITLDNVSFSYGREAVLENSSFVINKGESVAVVGASGIGKSTLLKLILGVYCPNSGKLYIDTDSEKINLDVNTRKLFTYVPQGNMLFSGTIRENITFLNEKATEEEIQNALKISCVEKFINELPNGLDTVVGENGMGLSEGQVQRVAIARAVLKKAPIMLLDESTSALDGETEKEVLSNLKQIKGSTIIMISHRNAVYSVCDKTLEVKNKKITTK